MRVIHGSKQATAKPDQPSGSDCSRDCGVAPAEGTKVGSGEHEMVGY
jgi:hypothetical protein